mmetsp:Transcript_4333/g.11351  ORF Transcript_4333/g.11351 Transcript_4333/m.11351 type:complete len:105 (+) Transcript_4333:1786-2100(+)
MNYINEICSWCLLFLLFLCASSLKSALRCLNNDPFDDHRNPFLQRLLLCAKMPTMLPTRLTTITTPPNNTKHSYSQAQAHTRTYPHTFIPSKKHSIIFEVEYLQ